MSQVLGNVISVHARGEEQVLVAPYHIVNSGKIALKPHEKKARSLKRRAQKLFSKKMSHRQLKLDGLYDVDLDGLTYRDFLPMHTLWTQYLGKMCCEVFCFTI